MALALRDSDYPLYLSVKHAIKSEAVAPLVAGGIAGAVLRTVVSPFERAKILLQLQAPGLAQVYRGMFPTIARMVRDEGWRGLFRGNLLNCVRIVPYLAVQYQVYESTKTWLRLHTGEGPGHSLLWWQRLVAGSVGGIALVLVTYPLDLVRARITVRTASLSLLDKAKLEQAPSVLGTMRDVYRNEGGLRALYRGLVPTTLGVAPYVAINFTLYEKMRDYMDASDANYLNPAYKLGAAALSSFIGGVLIYPLDVLRKRYQVASMAGGELGFHHQLVWRAVTNLFKQEGVRGAYRGMTANLYKIVPLMAVSWYCYDGVRAAIKDW